MATDSSISRVANKETLRVLFKELGLDLDTMIACKRLGMIHDIVYLAHVFGIDLGYKFVWYSVRT